jgi:tetratricopeptide (TPR) repeat protein
MRNLSPVKLRTLTAAVVVGLAVCQSGIPEAAAQFSAAGRRPPKPGTSQPPASRPPPTRAPGRPPPAPAAKNPSPDALIARYTGIVMQQPGAQFPLQRLAQLYRERDGKLDKLVEQFEQRAAKPGPDQWTALVALAGIYRQAGQRDRSVSTYEQAITQKPNDPIALVALGHLLNDGGDRAGARQRFEQALPHLKTDSEREQLLRTLMGLCLELKDWDGAKRHHTELVKRAKGSFYVRGELGRELLLRGQYARAVTEYEDVVKAATGDNRVLGPALRDLGKAQAKVGNKDAAMKTLRRALRISGAQSGIRREIYEIIVEIYRADDQLPELIAELEQQRLNDFQQLRMLGSLYEETGQVAKALATYQKALQKNARDVDTRVKVVQLLQIQGELAQAIKEYEALIRAAPRNPDFVFQLAEALIQRGDRDQALTHLRRLEQRSGRDEETLAALVDFYERVEEGDRAMALLQKLSQMGARDPRHLVELGERYWQQGEKEKAKRTWERILVIVGDRALARFTLGEVYLEHAMPEEGLEALREAMKAAPTKLKFRKAYALALEREPPANTLARSSTTRRSGSGRICSKTPTMMPISPGRRASTS